LDEKKSKHVGLAQQNGFGLTFLQRKLDEKKSKHVGLAQQNGFGLTFLHRLLAESLLP
jgi:hypothetical protein